MVVKLKCALFYLQLTWFCDQRISTRGPREKRFTGENASLNSSEFWNPSFPTFSQYYNLLVNCQCV